MNYNRITLNESFLLIGIKTIINEPATAPEHIGKVWQVFFKSVDEIPNKTANKHIYAAYTDYRDTQSAQSVRYTYCVGVQITSIEFVTQKYAIVTIPTGNYAHYKVKGPMPSNLISFWHEFWKTKLDYQRAFTLDYEVHSLENEQVDVYIAIK